MGKSILGYLGVRSAQLPTSEYYRLKKITQSGGDRYVISFTNSQELIWTIPEFPDCYQGGTISIDVNWISADTSGDVVLNAYVEAIAPTGTTTASSFDIANTQTSSVSGPAGTLFTTTIVLTNKDSVAIGDMVRIKLEKDSSSTSVGEFDVFGGTVYETISDLKFTDFDITTFTDIRTVNSGTITRTNDLISSITISGGRTLTITRDSSGYVSSITDGTHTWTYVRDANKNLISWSAT